ncbi:MAG: SMC-Scp complex subunit ScpB, partial [Nitrososphaera sp.]
QVYSHVKILEQLQFVEHENLGRLKVYRTTPKFQNYFGITDLAAMKSKLVATSSKQSPPTPRAANQSQSPEKS